MGLMNAVKSVKTIRNHKEEIKNLENKLKSLKDEIEKEKKRIKRLENESTGLQKEMIIKMETIDIQNKDIENNEVIIQKQKESILHYEKVINLRNQILTELKKKNL